jgi:peptide/nickel transport system substrate-binding protein
MMTTTRRRFITGAAGLIAAPHVSFAQTAPTRARTLRAVMHSDLRVFDPIWTTANITAYHGAMIYDTLFAVDENFAPQPQMVSKWGVSDDKKTYTFELRDGLAFSDGTPVASADCVASIRRWAARDGFGQHLFRRVADTPVVDDKTFRIILSEPYGLVIQALAKLDPSLCFIMKKKDAETDPNTQVRDALGSGPFTINRDETRPGNRYVYDRNAAYKPRSEAASGLSGGKVVKLDRVIFENIADQGTALAALQNGEIDFYEVPPQDLLDGLESDPNIVVQGLNKTGHMGWMRLNHLHPPFDKVEARRAMLHLVKQSDIMKAVFGEKRWKECGAFFACGTDMENDAGLDWLKEGQNLVKARDLFKASGYDGRPVVLLQASDHYLANPAPLLIAQWLRQAGVNAEVASSDWGGTVTRRSNRKPPAEGGWNIFITAATGYGFSNPIAASGHAATGDKAWFGWPENAKQEQLRDAWALAPTLPERQKLARDMQANAYDYVHHVYLGQFFRASAWRKNVKGIIGMPEVVPFWNVEKT